MRGEIVKIERRIQRKHSNPQKDHLRTRASSSIFNSSQTMPKPTYNLYKLKLKAQEIESQEEWKPTSILAEPLP